MTWHFGPDLNPEGQSDKPMFESRIPRSWKDSRDEIRDLVLNDGADEIEESDEENQTEAHTPRRLSNTQAPATQAHPFFNRRFLRLV